MDLTSLQEAINSLERSILLISNDIDINTLSSDHQELLKAGIIQHFELTYELCWKYIQRWIQNNISPDQGRGVSRRELFRIAAENKLIGNIESWMEFHKARNLIAHTYNQLTSEEVYRRSF